MMKKILFLAIGLLIAGSVSAQKYFNSAPGNYDSFFQPKIGFEVGANISNIASNTASNFCTGTLTGFNAGITFELPLASAIRLSLAPEVLYSQKGYTAVTVNGNFTQRTQFIDVPLLAKFKIAPIFSFYVGPQASFLMLTKNTYDNGFIVTNQKYYDNSSNNLYLDGVVGVSFDLTQSVDLHARYTMDLQQNNSNGNIYVPNYSSQVWQIGLGFKF
jgi:opacity protein-like surface antigen